VFSRQGLEKSAGNKLKKRETLRDTLSILYGTETVAKNAGDASGSNCNLPAVLAEHLSYSNKHGYKHRAREPIVGPSPGGSRTLFYATPKHKCGEKQKGGGTENRKRKLIEKLSNVFRKKTPVYKLQL